MTYLITGGTGSMGKQLTKHLLADKLTKRIVIYSRDEYKHAVMGEELNDKRLRFFIGDVRDEPRLELAMQGVDYCIHTAALKRVEQGEYEPREFKKTNIDGSECVINACMATNVKRAVLLATDKGVEAINIYGQSKGFAESEFIASNHYKPIFSVVRYGNVVSSRGSVVQRYMGIRERGEKVYPVTDPGMTRFAMTYDMAIHLVMLALREQAQQIFVAKAKSFDLASLVKAFRGKMEIIGERPGEKLHEVLIHRYESRRAQDFWNHFRIRPQLPYDDSIKYTQGNPLEPMYEYNSHDNPARMSVDDIREMIGVL